MGSSEENTTISPKLIAGLVSGCDLESSKTFQPMSSLSFAPKKKGYVCFEKTFSPVHLLVWAAAAKKVGETPPRSAVPGDKDQSRGGEEKSFFANFPFPSSSSSSFSGGEGGGQL